MPHPAPRVLPENAGLAFAGERRTQSACIPPKMAERFLGARNPHGKSNADVLRRLVTAADPRPPQPHWQIDFPSDMDAREASLYEHPYHHLARRVRTDHDGWWINPQADTRLRAALARRERYLASPVGTDPPDFFWLESSLIPDATLVAVARDDDFTHGVLRSRAFARWWRQVHSRRTPTLTIESYPFPWPPVTALSSLTAGQEEHRLAVARAVRGRDADQLNTAVNAAYGWPADLGEDDLLSRLSDLNRTRGVRL